MIATFPHLPYQGYTWPLTQHMGVINSGNLYPILWAADNFSEHDDPSLRINEYLIANNVFTANIRNDSGQPDAWRDYQQILSELGLIYSTEVSRQITLTPLGIAYLDKLITYSELMILQAFRYQYPNGHKIVISPSLRSDLDGSPLANLRNLVELQQTTNISIRPAVLIWQVLRSLGDHSDQGFLTLDEIRNYIMRCTSHNDTEKCVAAILKSRSGREILPPLTGSRGRRNMQDWIKFLTKTPLFTIENRILRISYDGITDANNIDSICTVLSNTHTFWIPRTLDRDDRISWYSFFGSIDLRLELNSQFDTNSIELIESFDDQDEEYTYSKIRSIALQHLSPDSLRGLKIAESRRSTTIDVTYDAEIADQQHRLHDRMVVLISSYFVALGADVYYDPKTVDILVELNDAEFLIEVKSATSKNINSKIRTAIGQILYYDYLRSNQSPKIRRKMIALTAKAPDDAWYIDFLNGHLDIDLITLDGQNIKVYSSSELTNSVIYSTPT